jgi:hypothetical protein
MSPAEMRNARNNLEPGMGSIPPAPPRIETGTREAGISETTREEVVAGGSLAEAACGIGVIVLAILGLAGIFPFYLAAVGVLAMGAALTLEGAAIAVGYSRKLEAAGLSSAKVAEVGGGMTAETLGGVAGIVLGILSLVGVAWSVLLPVALIAFGGALMLGTGATARLDSMHECLADRTRRLLRETVNAAAGIQALAGIAAIVLGILGLVFADPIMFTLIGLLCTGAAGLLSGAAVGGRMLALLNR